MQVSVCVLVLGAAVMAVEATISIPNTGEGRNLTSAAYISSSLVNGLLLAAGYSDVCVAAALETCGPEAEPVQRQLPPIMKEARQLLQEVRQVVSQYENRLRHCKDLLDAGDDGTGPRHVYPYPAEPYRRAAVYCDQTTVGGGWTVIQRRMNVTDREDFSRSWAEYMLGFGELEGEFWLGLDLMHVLTSTVLQELRIELADYEGGERLAKYGFFYVGPPEDHYRLKVGSYTGDAGDSLKVESHGHTFSTNDAIHPTHKQHCAKRFKGGWWFGVCQHSNLNGLPHEGIKPTNDGIFWKAWRGPSYSLRHVTMMVRPAPRSLA